MRVVLVFQLLSLARPYCDKYCNTCMDSIKTPCGGITCDLYVKDTLTFGIKDDLNESH